MRDLLLCLTITANLLIYGFIGLNYGAFKQVISYKSKIIIEEQPITTNHSLQTTHSKSPKPPASSLKLRASSKSLSLSKTKKDLSTWQGTLSIPSIDITAPIQHEPGSTVSDIQDLLSEGTMSLSPFISPNKDERMIIFGHSSDYRWKNNPYASIFALLPQIKVGDTITMTHQNQTFAYTVKKTQITAPDLHELIEEKPKHNELILSTCYPIGFFSQRFNVIATPTFIPPETELSPESNDQITNPNVQQI
jgi:sortase A